MSRISKYNITGKDSGVYLIKNIINNKVYVGSAKRLIQRLSHHKNILNKNKHHSIHLQNAWNKYGKDNFEFYILEIIENIEELRIVEQKFIDLFNCSEDKYGYNICPEAKSNLNSKHTKGIENKRKRMMGSGNNFYNKNHSKEAKY